MSDAEFCLQSHPAAETTSSLLLERYVPRQREQMNYAETSM
jgi:hypothetical protein